MVKVQGAVISEQGVSFAVVIVKPHILSFDKDREEAIALFSPLFPGMPIVLMAQDAKGEAQYRGRKDLVDILLAAGMERIAWKEYTFHEA